MMHVQTPSLVSAYSADLFLVEGLDDYGMLRPICVRKYERPTFLLGNFNSIGLPLSGLVKRLQQLTEKKYRDTRR